MFPHFSNFYLILQCEHAIYLFHTLGEKKTKKRVKYFKSNCCETYEQSKREIVCMCMYVCVSGWERERGKQETEKMAREIKSP